MKKELSVAAVMAAITLLGVYLMCQIEIQAACTFPKVVLSIMLLLALLHGAQTLVNQRKLKTVAKTGRDKKPYPVKLVLITLVCILVYFTLMETIGFYVSAFLFFLIITLLLQDERFSVGGVILRTVSCLAFVGVLFVLFNQILSVQTPKGILF